MLRGVLNIVHGTKDTVNRILDHPDIKAVSFVGGNQAGEYIYARGAANGKRCQVCILGFTDKEVKPFLLHLIKPCLITLTFYECLHILKRPRCASEHFLKLQLLLIFLAPSFAESTVNL